MVADAGPDGIAPPPPADAGPPAEVGTFQLPRTPADPRLTRKIVDGVAGLVGGDWASCSHAPGATGDRWCAFSKSLAPAPGTELWVINISEAVRGAIPACDGGSSACLKLTGNLWTGTPLWGPFHPSTHRFEGDTLLYHADQAPGGREPYQGAVWAWRPGWAAPRKITGDRGLQCHVEHRSTAAFCLDNAVAEKDPASPFDRPYLREFDLLAGKLDGAAGGPLATVAHIKIEGSDRAWRARFTADGEYLLYSVVPAPGGRESLYVLKTADAGKAAPPLVLEDVAEWEIAHDDKKIYLLRGYDRRLGETATGTLVMADLPTGANAVDLRQQVLWFELIGAGGEVFSTIDRGLLLALPGANGLPAMEVMRDRTKPEMRFRLISQAQAAQVSLDAVHTAYFADVRGADFPSAFVVRNDGSGRCQLTQDFHAETYGVHFSDDARRVFWIEYGRNQSESEEGWYARPDTCGDRVKFGDFVGWYTPVRDEFVVFDGGDLEDTTRWLQYTSLKPAPGVVATPLVIQERPDGVVTLVEAEGKVWTLFATGGMDPPALYLHGPLRHPAP